MASDIRTEYRPDYAVPPGETLRETLDEMGMTQTDLARRIGLSRKTVNLIMGGKAPLTPEVALDLETVTGVPARLWNSLETNYRDALQRIERYKELEAHKEWAKRFPINEMIARGCMPARDRFGDQVDELLRFLRIASPDAWSSCLEAAAISPSYRLDQKHVPDHMHLYAWLCQGEREAEGIPTKPHSESGFRAALEEARSLTREAPAVFQPRLEQVCADAGVVVVFVKQYQKTRAHGAARWLAPDRAIIQLSIRRKWADILWFSFFHEAGHLLLHGKRQSFVDYRGNESDEESQADLFASNMLIPPDAYGALVADLYLTPAKIELFAEEVGVSPGIVVGRLQHDGLVPHNSPMNRLRRRLQWVDGA